MRLRTIARRALAFAAVVLTGASCSSVPSSSASNHVATEPKRVVVRAEEYAFDLPARLPSGPTTFVLKNVGDQPHDLILGRLRRDAPPLDRLIGLPNSGQFVDIGMNDGEQAPFARPGRTAQDRLNVDLEPGTYVYVCMVHDVRTREPHARLGMTGAFSVASAS